MDQISNLALRGYGEAGLSKAAAQKPGNVAEVATSFERVLAEAENQASKAVTTGADPHALVEALASSQMAVETAVTIRDRVVEAYQEILRMPM
jgi:flagellar hook-basal body complex protein FliE